MKFAEDFFKIFKRADKSVVGPETAPEAQASPEKKAMSPKEMKALLDSVKERLDSIRKINNEKKSANTPEKITKFEGKLETAKQKFATDFGVEYDPSFDNVKNAIKNKEAGQVNQVNNVPNPVVPNIDNQAAANNQAVSTPDANLNQTAPDQTQNNNQAQVNPDQAQAQNQVQVNPDQNPINPDQVPSTPEPEVVEPGPYMDYRRHLESLRVKEGAVEKVDYKNFEYTRKELASELDILSKTLYGAKLKGSYKENLADWAQKAGKSEEEIKKIYEDLKNKKSKADSNGTVISTENSSGLDKDAKTGEVVSQNKDAGVNSVKKPDVINPKDIKDAVILGEESKKDITGKDGEKGKEEDEKLEEAIKKEVEKLYRQELDKKLADNLKELAAKTGLSEEEIKEIYRTQEENILAEAKDEINKSTTTAKKISKAVLKSGAYIVGGIGLVATLGIGGLVGAGIIGGARILDRIYNVVKDKKKLNSKVDDIKSKKTDEDEIKLQDRLAGAISLKKKITVDKVDLKNGADRTKLIDSYIEEQDKAGLLEVAPDQIMNYKDKIVRVLEGLDDIDKFNNEKENSLNKTTLIERGATFLEKKILFGETTGEQTRSTILFAGIGIAAREIAPIRIAMGAITGYRLGGLAADYVANRWIKDKSAVDLGEGPNEENYQAARIKLLDKDFQKNNPVEYLDLKKQVEDIEAEILRKGGKDKDASSLNADLNKNIGDEKKASWKKRGTKIVGRLGGAILGGFGANALYEATKGTQNKDSNTAETIDKTVGGKLTAETPIDTTLAKPVGGGESSVDSTTVADSTMAKPAGGGSQEVPVPPDSSKGSASETIAPKGESKAPNLEVPVAGVKGLSYEDKITNENLKPGHTDSVWHSTNQIFKDHAAELGYKGDVKDTEALEAWSKIETAKAINNSGGVEDKVFEGNKIVLNEIAKDKFSVEVEKGEGFTPGHLEHASQGAGARAEDVVTPKNDAPEVPVKERGADYEELKKQFIEKSKADIRAQHEFLYHDKYGVKIDDVVIKEGAEAALHNSPITPAAGSESILFDHSSKSTPFGFEQDTGSSSGSENSSVAAQEVHSDVSGGKTSDSANIETGKGSAESSSEETKTDINKSAIEDPSAYKLGAEFKDLGADEVKKVFSSVENLKDLPNGARANLGELVMAKRDGVYHFETKEYEKFHMVFNKLSEVGQNDKFSIIQNGHVLDGKSLSEAIPLKQTLYDNLPDKRTSLAKELLKEISKNKEQAEFLSEF